MDRMRASEAFATGVPSTGNDGNKTIDLQAYFEWVDGRETTLEWKRSLKSISARIMPKSIYSPEEMFSHLEAQAEQINAKRSHVRAIKLFLNYCRAKRLVPIDEFEHLNRLLRKKRQSQDVYVPTTEEVKTTLEHLPERFKPLFQALLVSGIRESQLDFILRNRDSLTIQHVNGFSKILLNSHNNGNKSGYYAYFPSAALECLLGAKATLIGLRVYMQKHKKLVRPKYLRKYFYTAAIEAGVPSEVADYIQSRAQTHVGGRHYLAVQQLADANYGKVSTRIRGALKE